MLRACFFAVVALSLLSPCVTAAGTVARDPVVQHGESATVRGEALDPSCFGPSWVETMAEALAREKALGREADLAQQTEPMPVPLAPAPRRLSISTGEEGFQAQGGGGTPPVLSTNFQGPTRNDPGAGWIPPDSHGAIGPNHFLSIVNQRLQVYDRSGVAMTGMSTQTFFGVGGSIGDPRAAYDHHSGRFVITCSDFSSRVYLAVSSTNNPNGAWFKTSIIVSAGVDAGHWPDYPTLGFDANGFYTAAFMVGGADTMSLFAIDKAPLVAPVQSLGTVTAFRSLPYEDAIQPCLTFGSPSGEYLVSRASGLSLRIRRVNPPLNAPTLTEVGMVAVPANNDPPNAPAQGSGVALATIDARPLGAVFQAGSVWMVHHINVSGRSGARWYQINPTTLLTQQVGTIDDPVRHYFFPSIAVNGNGDCAFGFSGSHAGEFAGTWFAGRKSTDAAGQTSTPASMKPGVAAYQALDGAGRNRWGDYSNTTLDPVDGNSFWTIQEYTHATNIWGTWIGKLDYPGNLPVPFCAGDGVDPDVTQLCPCFNFGQLGKGCDNSTANGGALLTAAGTTNPDTLVLSQNGEIGSSTSVFLQGDVNNVSGVTFGDGVRCVAGNLKRLYTKPASAGAVSAPTGAEPSITARSSALGDPIAPGSTRYYQVYYRDQNLAFCPAPPGDSWNVGNGLVVIW